MISYWETAQTELSQDTDTWHFSFGIYIQVYIRSSEDVRDAGRSSPAEWDLQIHIGGGEHPRIIRCVRFARWLVWRRAMWGLSLRPCTQK